MKKVIPFSQDIIFKTNVAEITSISLEHSLEVGANNTVSGEFIISGDYRISDSSINTEEFSYNLPFDISLDDRYILDNVTIDIDDFYYDLINNSILSVNIDVLIDNLEEKEIPEINFAEPEEITIESTYEENASEPVITSEVYVRNEEDSVSDIKISEINEEVKVQNKEEAAKQERTLFDSFDTSVEQYVTYKVYIVKEGDSIESILQLYDISKEDVEKYNDLNDLKIGDKIIIPSVSNEKI